MNFTLWNLNVHADRFSTKVLDSDVIIVITPFFMSFNSAWYNTGNKEYQLN